MSNWKEKRNNDWQKLGSEADWLERIVIPLNPLLSEDERTSFANGVKNPAPRKSIWDSDETNSSQSENPSYVEQEEPKLEEAEEEIDEEEDEYYDDDDDYYDYESDYESEPVIEQEPEPIYQHTRIDSESNSPNGYSYTSTTLTFYTQEELDKYVRFMRAVDPDFELESNDLDEEPEEGIDIGDLIANAITGLIVGGIVNVAERAGLKVTVTEIKQ